MVRGYRQEGIRWIDTALRLASGRPQDQLYAWALVAAGSLRAGVPGERETAREHVLAALEIAGELGAPDVERAAAGAMGILVAFTGNLRDAERWTEKALEIARRIGDRTRVGELLSNLSCFVLTRHDFEAGRDLAVEAIEELGDSPDLGVRAAAHQNLGTALVHLGATYSAAEQAQRSLRLFRAADELDGMYAALTLIAAVASGGAPQARSVHLLAAANGIRENCGIEFQPLERELFDQTKARLRAGLGGRVFDRAWAEGQSMTLEEGIDLGEQVAAAQP